MHTLYTVQYLFRATEQAGTYLKISVPWDHLRYIYVLHIVQQVLMWTCVRFCIPCDSTNGRRIYWNVLVKTNQDLPIFIKPIVDFHHHMCVISLQNKNKNYHNVDWYFCSACVGIIYLWCRPYKYKDYLYHVCEFWLGLSRIICVYCISTMQIVMANTQLMWALYLSDVDNRNVDSTNTPCGLVLAETFT